MDGIMKDKIFRPRGIPEDSFIFAFTDEKYTYSEKA